MREKMKRVEMKMRRSRKAKEARGLKISSYWLKSLYHINAQSVIVLSSWEVRYGIRRYTI
jgi:hypothetical protein